MSLLPLLSCLAFAVSQPADIPIGSLTTLSLGDWKQIGNAFETTPFSQAELKQFEITNNQDNLVLSSKRQGDAPQGQLISAPFTISKRSIAFRVGGGNFEKRTCLNLIVGGKVVRSSVGHRSDRLVSESWNVIPWIGKSAQIQIVDEASGDWGHITVDHIIQTNTPEVNPTETGSLYHESLRPQFHFTARQWTVTHLNPGMREEGWVNDLNGLIYYDGEFHLFAQRWAKCWLHAVSKDLVHWTELEPAFWEEELDSGVQSGTCVIDYHNTSGLGKDPKQPPMIAFWSRFDNRSQCLCFSLDHGRTWTRYAKNPLMIHPERDPKVFWYEPGKHWVMIMYGDGQYHILTSHNLLEWHDEHHPIPNSFECPDFFELPIDGDKNNKKWVLIQGSGFYSIGTFDGKQFHEESERFPCDVGTHFYATQSWANTETGDGRRIQTAWMRGADFPNMPFNQMISFPCELSLHSTPDGLRVFRKPVREIELLHQSKHEWNDLRLESGVSVDLADSGDLFHIRAEVEIPGMSQLEVNYRGVPVHFASHAVESGTEPKNINHQIHSIELLLDRTSIETFVNEGELSSTRFVLPKGIGLKISAHGGSVQIRKLQLFGLRSAWTRR